MGAARRFEAGQVAPVTKAGRAGYAVLGILMGAACGSACAADPLGFYIGAGVGQAHVRSELDAGALSPIFSGALSTQGTKTGWKAIVGIRPLSIIGAEAEYLDFGSATGSASIPATVTSGGLQQHPNHPPKTGALAFHELPPQFQPH